MDDLQKIRAAIAIMEKKTSLRQVALQSGINYITLRNIKSGKSGRVTDGVIARFNAFEAQFAASPESTTVRRGRKPASAASPEKPGRKAKVALKAGKAPAPVKRVLVAKPKVKAKLAPKPKAKPKAKAKGRPAAPKAISPVAAVKSPDLASSLLGGTLTKEIRMAEARLDFLKQLQKLESDFLRKIGK